MKWLRSGDFCVENIVRVPSNFIANFTREILECRSTNTRSSTVSNFANSIKLQTDVGKDTVLLATSHIASDEGRRHFPQETRLG